MLAEAAALRLDPRSAFYARSVHDVARDLIGCILRHGGTAGRIVETESYHVEEPACHAYAGSPRAPSSLFGPPGGAYVYRSYGVHALLNAVAEDEGVGAAALIRALEPLDGHRAHARAARPGARPRTSAPAPASSPRRSASASS